MRKPWKKGTSVRARIDNRVHWAVVLADRGRTVKVRIETPPGMTPWDVELAASAIFEPIRIDDLPATSRLSEDEASRNNAENIISYYSYGR